MIAVMRKIGLALGLIAFSSHAVALVPTPRLKPQPPALSEYITDQDARILRSALSRGKRGDWAAVDASIAQINDPTAKNLLVWYRARQDRQAPMSTLTYAANALSDWPSQVTIRAKAEDRLFEEPLSPDETIFWFNGREPVSGEGRAALARAFFAKGDEANGLMWLRFAWREARLSRSAQRELFKDFRDHLTPEDHAARADHLIWQGSRYYSMAQALLPHMNPSDRALKNARLKLARNASGMDAAIDALGPEQMNDPGFLYERARWRRRKRTKDYALPLYLQINEAPINETGKTRMWREKKLMAFWLIEEDQYAQAYDLATRHGTTSGTIFAEAEFLAGWLALRKLNQPEAALTHFRRLESGVSTPISLARALYWQGRAHEALKDGLDSQAYGRAANFPNTFYGQLANSRRQAAFSNTRAVISLPPQIISPGAQQAFNADERVRAMRLLGEAGEERLFSIFAFHLDDALPDLEQLGLLSQLSADYGFMRPSIRAAKEASRFQTLLTDSGYPIVGPIESLGPEFDTDFVYAIARQESEFAANAVSSANAYGMMQMIQPTARATARIHRIPYDRGRLITDRDYSARLGALHLHDLLQQFDGSYILAAVGYNAGPHRAKQWIQDHGDPRTGEVDPIDWIESIPFSETRNYVMRVLENMQVYEARRNGDTAEVVIDEKLRYGSRHPNARR